MFALAVMGNGTGFTVLNASSAEVSGVAVETFFAATAHLRLGASVTWLDTGYGDDIPEPAPPVRDLTQAPDCAAANLGYERPITGRLNGFFNANWVYQGEQYLAYDIQDKQSDCTLLGLQLVVRTPDQRWDLRVWCDNFLDHTYAIDYCSTPFYVDDNLDQHEGQFQGLHGPTGPACASTTNL